MYSQTWRHFLIHMVPGGIFVLIVSLSKATPICLSRTSGHIMRMSVVPYFAF